MTIAREIINRAGSLIGVKRANVDLPDSDLAAGLDQLQDWLVERQIAGVKFPSRYPTTLDDDLMEPDWTRSYIKTSLAMRLAGEFTIQPNVTLLEQMRMAKNAVYQRLFSDMTVTLPDTLPVGSGNVTYGDWWREFYLSSYDDVVKTATGDLLGDGEGRQILYHNGPSNGRNIITGG